MNIKETAFKGWGINRAVDYAEEMGYSQAQCCAIAAMYAIQPPNIIPLLVGDCKDNDHPDKFECDNFAWVNWKSLEEEYNPQAVATAVHEWVGEHSDDDFFHNAAKCEVRPLFVVYRTYDNSGQVDDEEYFTLHYGIISDVFGDGDWTCFPDCADITERVAELMQEQEQKQQS